MSYDHAYVTVREERLHTLGLIAWVTYAVGLLTAWVTGPIGFILALIKLGEARGTIYESHFRALIRSGIILFVGYAVGWITTPILIGFGILAIMWLYNVWVVVKGILRIVDRRPY